jgi:hypothetical protein
LVLAQHDDENGQDESGDSQASELMVHQIVPADTDPRINTYSGKSNQHWSWYNSSGHPKHQLIVFLPGTGGKGKGSGKFNKMAARLGFHVLSLAYPDDISLTVFHRSDDKDAFAKGRSNVITGSTPYGPFTIDRPDSIDNRLVAALRYLAKHFPQEHWDEFLDANKNIAWDKTILSGQSQGGGHACYLGMRLHKVAKIIVFGAPKDFSRRFNAPAKWLSAESITPINRVFCFNHTDDAIGCNHAEELKIYQAMGLVPSYKDIDVDKAQPPFDHTRLLTSTAPTGDPHNAPLHDARYRQVWKYLLLEPVQ